MIRGLQSILIGFTISLLLYTPAFANSLTDPFRPDDISTGLQAYYKLNEASGSRSDSSGNSNTLTDNNTVGSIADDYWSTGENSADAESSSSEYLSIADGSQTGLDITGSYTVSAFIKAESTTGTGTIIGKTNNTTGYAVRINSTNNIEVINGSSTTTSTGTIDDGKWHNVVVVYNTTDDLVSYYIDGKLDSVDAQTTDPTNTAHAFHVGSRGATATDFFDGILKDVAIWNVVLTPEEINSIAVGIDIPSFTYRPSDTTTAPVAYWKLNQISDGSATSRTDSSGNSHTLTDNNTIASGGGYTESVGADFESTNSEYFSSSDSADFDFSDGTWTVAAWIKVESLDDQMNIYHVSDDSDNEHFIRINSSGKLSSGMRIGGVNVVNLSGTPTPIKIGTWHHIAVTENGDDFQSFVDGVEIDSASDVDRAINFGSGPDIGRDQPLTADYFDGVIMDLAVWQVDIGDAEVASLAAGMPVQQSGVVSYYKLDEGSGNATDNIGSNTLTDNATVGTGTGQVGSARDFESTNSEYFSITDGSQSGLDLVDEMTLLAWTNPESVTSSLTIMDKDGDVDGYGLDQHTDDTLRFQLSGTNNASTSTVTVSTWVHLSGVADGANELVYFNSAEEANTTISSSSVDNSADFTLGALNTPAQYYDGLIDEVVIAERWFRNEEVKAAYNKGLNAKEFTSSEKTVAAPDTRRVIIL